MASTKPTIIIVHGAWHRPDCYDLIKKRLEGLSYEIFTITSPTTNVVSKTINYKDDVEEIHKVMIPLLDAGKQVTIVGHSYGGIPSCASTEGQSIAERSKAGKKGGVRSIVFLCAFALPERETNIRDVNHPSDTSWIQPTDEGFLVCSDWAKTIFYEDLSMEDRDFWFKKLGKQTPDLKVPSMYLVAEKDRAIQLVVQEKMIAAVPGMKTMRVPCGHSPFLSHPDETVEVIVKGAELG